MSLFILGKAVLGDDLQGQQGWLKQVDSLAWLRAEATRLASLYEQDGRLDSNGKPIRDLSGYEFNTFFPAALLDRSLELFKCLRMLTADLQVVIHNSSPDVAISAPSSLSTVEAFGILQA